MTVRNTSLAPLTLVALFLHLGLAVWALSDSHALFRDSVLTCYGAAFISLLLVFSGTALQFYRAPHGRPIASILSIHVITYVLTLSGIYRGYGLSAGEGIDYPDRVTAVYFSIVTITTLGYGDFSPREPLRLLAAMEAVSGLIVFGIFVGIIAHSLNRAGDDAGAAKG